MVVVDVVVVVVVKRLEIRLFDFCKALHPWHSTVPAGLLVGDWS